MSMSLAPPARRRLNAAALGRPDSLPHARTAFACNGQSMRALKHASSLPVPASNAARIPEASAAIAARRPLGNSRDELVRRQSRSTGLSFVNARSGSLTTS
jgi:hypothetical protein